MSEHQQPKEYIITEYELDEIFAFLQNPPMFDIPEFTLEIEHQIRSRPAPTALQELESLKQWILYTAKTDPLFHYTGLVATIECRQAALRAREVRHGKNIPMVDRGAPDRYTSVSLEEWERMQRGDPHG